MSRLMVDGLIGFMGAFLGLMAAAALVFFWAKKRILTLQARLVTRVASGDFSLRSLLAALRVRRHAVTVAMVRRQLRHDADRTSMAVAEAELGHAMAQRRLLTRHSISIQWRHDNQAPHSGVAWD